jgi:hypothetical protein
MTLIWLIYADFFIFIPVVGVPTNHMDINNSKIRGWCPHQPHGRKQHKYLIINNLYYKIIVKLAYAYASGGDTSHGSSSLTVKITYVY